MVNIDDFFYDNSEETPPTTSGYVITFTPSNGKPHKKIELYFNEDKSPHMISTIRHNETAEVGEMSSIPSFFKLDESYCTNRILAEIFRASADADQTSRTITKVSRMPQPTPQTHFWNQPNKSRLGGPNSVCQQLLETFDENPSSVQINEGYVDTFRYPGSFQKTLGALNLIQNLQRLRADGSNKKAFPSDRPIKQILQYILNMRNPSGILTKSLRFYCTSSVKSFDSFVTEKVISTPTTEHNIWGYSEEEIFWIVPSADSCSIPGRKSSFERHVKEESEEYSRTFSVSTGTDIAAMWDVRKQQTVLKCCVTGHREFRAGSLIQESKKQKWTMGVYVPSIESHITESNYQLLKKFGVV